MRPQQPKGWERYEAVAADLLNRIAADFGLDRVEGKQKIWGKRTSWEIDAKGMRNSDGAVILVECRRKRRKLDQEALAAIAYRIQDTGAQVGIVITPSELQPGASKIATGEGIIEVQLDRNSTPIDFAMRFFGRLMAGASIQAHVAAADLINAEASRLCSSCRKRFPLVDYHQRRCQPCETRAADGTHC